MTKKKNKPQPVHLCMFCNSPGMTKQHVWPQWFGKYLDVDPNKGYTHLGGHLYHDEDLNRKYKPINKRFNKDLSLRHVRRVCYGCNSGWLSVLEQKNIPFLSKVILGESVLIDIEYQQLIATWAVMASMVNDYGNENSRLIKRTERSYFFNEKLPSTKWKVWITKINETPDRVRCYDEHFNVQAVYKEPEGKNTFISYPTIFTFFRIKNCLIFTSYTDLQNVNFSFDGFANNAMIEIYPNNLPIVDLTISNGLSNIQVNMMIPFLSRQHPFLAT